MKKISKICLVISFLSVTLLSTACKKQDDGDLRIAVVPTTPILIPFGEITVGEDTITAPYFIINQFNLLWQGQGTLSISTILIEATSGNLKIQCSLAGDDLQLMFDPIYRGTNGMPSIPQDVAKTEPIITRGSICGGLDIPTNLPTYNIPTKVTFQGAVIDANGNFTRRVKGTAFITIQ